MHAFRIGLLMMDEKLLGAYFNQSIGLQLSTIGTSTKFSNTIVRAAELICYGLLAG